MEPIYTTATELVRRIRAREVSSLEVVEAHWRDDVVVAAVRAIEVALGGDARPPLP